MREGSYLRLFGFFASLILPSLALGMIVGEAAVKRVAPALVAIPFAVLVGMALTSGSVWLADWGGYGAYKISRARERFWYWAVVGIWAAVAAYLILLTQW